MPKNSLIKILYNVTGITGIIVAILIQVIAFPPEEINLNALDNQEKLLQEIAVETSPFLPPLSSDIKKSARQAPVVAAGSGSRDDEDDDVEATTSGLLTVLNRVNDYYSGVQGIINSGISGNLKGILHGSIQFIPSPIRVGVESILGSIIGSPLNPNRFNNATASNITIGVIGNNVTAPAFPEDINEAAAIRIPIAEQPVGTDTVIYLTTISALPESSTVEVTSVHADIVSTTVKDADDNDNDNDESEEEEDDGRLL